MPRYAISHQTVYSYSAPVARSNHVLHLSPRAAAHQRIERHSLLIEPAPTARDERIDYFGNPVVHLSIEAEHEELSITALSGIEVLAPPPPDLSATRPWRDFADQRVTAAEGLDRSVLDFVCRSRFAQPTPAIAVFARETVAEDAPVLRAAEALMSRIFAEFRFDQTTTEVSTPVDQVLEQKSGVCQDFAHLQLAALRSLGVPSRYVSGYIRTLPPAGQERLVGADASHAWLAVWAPETGWVDFDPTNNIIDSPDHITLAYGRDYEDVSPVSGVLLGGGEHGVSVSVDVAPL